MFSIGDKIVYPMHGAGIIQQIEERKILGEERQYYILKLPNSDVSVMIPVQASTTIGIRKVIDSSEIENVLALLRSENSDMDTNWNRRYRENMEKLRTGDILQVAEVFRNLTRIDSKKKLSAGENKMLSNAKQILVSEILISGEMTASDAEDLVTNAVLE